MKMFRLACILFISVLVTTTILSGTFAKYTTSMTSNNSARVAKWGVEVEMYGNLFGEAYDGTFNTIVDKNSNSATVKTIQSSSVSNLVSPGTKSADGLHFSISGVPETAIKIDYKIVNQNIALRPSLYGIMEKLGDISETDYDDLIRQGKNLYKEKNDLKTGSIPDDKNVTQKGFVKANRGDAISNIDIYELYNIVEVNHPTNTNANYPYCPVVFELKSTDPGSLKGVYNGGQVYPIYSSSLYTRYWIYRNEKTLDVLSAAIENQFIKTLTWPVASEQTKWKFVRSGSQTFDPGTDLSSLHLVDEQLTWSWLFEQYSDPSNPYARLFEDNEINLDQVKGYNAADTILSTLAGKKIGKSEKYKDLEVVIHNRSLTYSNEHVIFEAYKRKNGEFNINKNALANWNDLADEWIVPNEYEDYCLDVDFELEFRITQLD